MPTDEGLPMIRHCHVAAIAAGALGALLLAAAPARATLVTVAPTSQAIKSIPVTVTTTPTALPTWAMDNGFVCTAKTTNLAAIQVGGADVTASTNNYPLPAGQSISYNAKNLNMLWVVGANNTDVIYCTGN